MCEVTKNVRSGVVLAQEPWTYVTKFRSKLRGWNLFQGTEKGNRPRALGVFRFWTFLKSSCFRSLYGALDLKNNYCAKKIRKFYLLAIAHGG